MTLVWLALSFITGAVTAEVWSSRPAIASAVACVILAGLLSWVRYGAAAQLLSGRGRGTLLAGAAVLAVLGAWNQGRAGVDLGDVPALIGREATVRGVLVDEGDNRGSFVRRRVELREALVDGEWRPVEGRILWQASPFLDVSYGDLVELRGKIEEPPVFAGFDYRDYLARRGVGGILRGAQAEVLARHEGVRWREALFDFRADFAERLRAVLPEPEAALATGVTLGKRDALPPALVEDLNRTGLSHIVAVSGLNVTLVAAMSMALAPLLGYRRAWQLAVLVVVAYALMTGLTPSVVRSAFMGVIAIFALVSGRQANGLGALGLAAAAMLAWDPGLLDDAGFQLSAVATAAIVSLGPVVMDLLEAALARAGIEAHEGWPRALAALVAISAVATLATAPLVGYTFGRFPVLSLPANLLVEPVFPLMLVLGTAGGFLSYLPFAGEAVLLAAYFPFHYMVRVAEEIASLPFASVSVARFPEELLAALLLGLLLLAVALYDRWPRVQADLPPARAPRFPRPALAAGALAGVALAGVAVWWPDGGDGRLEIAFLDVGQGDAALIETPGGRRLLVDGGPEGGVLALRLAEELPFWDRRVDALLATHPQLDHIAGFVEVLDRYEVGVLYVNGAPADTLAFQALMEEAAEEGVPVVVLRQGDSLELDDGIRVDVLHPAQLLSGDANESSVVLRLVYREFEALLTGDIEELGQLALLASGLDLRSDLLKVPHHGGESELTDELLAAVQPSLAVVSAGADNRFGHPAQATLDALQGVPLFRTDLQGTVRVSTDGRRIEVTAGR